MYRFKFKVDEMQHVNILQRILEQKEDINRKVNEVQRNQHWLLSLGEWSFEKAAPRENE